MHDLSLLREGDSIEYIEFIKEKYDRLERELKMIDNIMNTEDKL